VQIEIAPAQCHGGATDDVLCDESIGERLGDRFEQSLIYPSFLLDMRVMGFARWFAQESHSAVLFDQFRFGRVSVSFLTRISRARGLGSWVPPANLLLREADGLLVQTHKTISVQLNPSHIPTIRGIGFAWSGQNADWLLSRLLSPCAVCEEIGSGER
jgi:hypothetical protein